MARPVRLSRAMPQIEDDRGVRARRNMEGDLVEMHAHASLLHLVMTMPAALLSAGQTAPKIHAEAGR